MSLMEVFQGGVLIAIATECNLMGKRSMSLSVMMVLIYPIRPLVNDVNKAPVVEGAVVKTQQAITVIGDMNVQEIKDPVQQTLG